MADSFEFWDFGIVPFTDPRRVECVGGPDDGDLANPSDNGLRPGGMYVPVNEWDGTGWLVVALRFVRFAS